ncbi:uncharacterized protein LOC114222353 [Eumetopias jubatus]|uniref:uncharacterized protein LOC114222353 n=1 Tax=Eumetopias jubatus TaxID=34886 RepID=UPI00101678B2|nr:uncharacterized protein LOC114222353 [Eumetopias jubatus]
MPILVCVSKEVSTSWVHRPQLPPFAQGLRGLSIMELLLHFSLGCPHQDPGAILPPFRIRGTASGFSRLTPAWCCGTAWKPTPGPIHSSRSSKVSHFRGCPSSRLPAPLPASRRRRQSTLLKSNTKPRPSSIPLGCILQLRARREVWGEGWIWQGRRLRAGHRRRSGSAGRGTLLGRTVEPLRWSRRTPGRGEPGLGAGQRRRPRLQRDPLAAERRGPPVSPGEPAALERRELSNTSTKRKGNQPALTCKQGPPSEEPAQTDPQAHSLAPRAACNPSTCPPQGPPGRGTQAGGGCRSRPRRLRPRIRSLMLFPARVKLIGGWGGEFTRAGDNLEPTAREDPDADRRKPTIKKMHPVGIFPLGPWAAEWRQTGSCSPVDADSGRFRKDPTVGGAD